MATYIMNDNDQFEIERFAGDSQPLCHCSDAEEDKERRGINETCYDSTNESEDVEKKNELVDCDLSKLYLNDIEVNNKEKEIPAPALTDKDKLLQEERKKSLRLAFGVVLRLIFPLATGVVQGIKGIRDVRFLKVVHIITPSREAVTNLFAFAANTISLNLSSVQVSHRLDLILKLLKIRKSHDGTESLPDFNTNMHDAEVLIPPYTPEPTLYPYSTFLREPRYSLPNFHTEYEATKFCTLDILAEPPAGQEIRADIVFIHGLHGSLVKTWRQGLWENERKPVEFQRPPKPPLRPLKRSRHSRAWVAHPSHHKKRARFANAERLSQERESIEEVDEYKLGEQRDFKICDDNFHTFHLRVHDNGQLLQDKYDSKQKCANDRERNTGSAAKTENCNIKENLNKKPLKASASDPNYSKCWPGDWLPIDCPGVRVIGLNYSTDQLLWRPLWKKKETRSNLIQRAREMTELLIKHRVGYGHPIVWVGHSKGGLFIKQIIVDAWESSRPQAAPFWRSSRGVFFYSVPHRGSYLASIKAPLLLRSVELIDIEKNNKYLLDLHRRFVGLYHLGHLKIEVFSFVETALTYMAVLYIRIIGVDSADPGIGDVCGIRLDHREICKPRSRECILYKELVNMINKVC